MTADFPAVKNPKHDAIQYHKTEKSRGGLYFGKKQRKPTSSFPAFLFMENYVCHLVFYIKTLKKAPIFSEKSQIDAWGLLFTMAKWSLLCQSTKVKKK